MKKLLILFIWAISCTTVNSQFILDTTFIHHFPVVHYNGYDTINSSQRVAVFNDLTNSLWPNTGINTATFASVDSETNHNWLEGDILYCFSGNILCGMGLYQDNNIDPNIFTMGLIFPLYGYLEGWAHLPYDNEDIEFVLYDSFTDALYDVQLMEADLMNGNFQFPDKYYLNGIYLVQEIYFPKQTIIVPEGWSIISSYLDLTSVSLNSIFPVSDTHLIYMKDGDGDVFHPWIMMNQIGSIEPKKGYQIKMSAADTITFEGDVLFDTEISLLVGWSLIGAPGWWNKNTELLFQSVDLMIIKDGLGLFYWPQWNCNNMYHLKPGEGYWVKMNQAGVINY